MLRQTIKYDKIMKRILLALSVCALAFASCTKDNYDGPDATVKGSFIDSKTGGLVGTDIQNGNQIRVEEQGFETPQWQTWYIKNTGEYENKLVFAATYKVKFENGNFYPFEDEITLKKGDNVKDFTVTPYIRIVEPKIERSGDIVTATFKLQGGKGDEKVNSIRLFAFSDMWVGNSVCYNISGGTDRQDLGNAAVDENKVYTLTIDTKANNTSFKYVGKGKNYYFRIGALASVDGVGTIRHNYSPLIVIKF